jgi:NADP-dependent 3-hydroxy acid dehydrogenase YdfG
MTRPLDGTVALVTGASSGIGEATARRLAADGASVAIVARRVDRLEELAESIRSEGGTALVVEADVTDEAQAIAAVERTVSELGRLDILINNTGVMLLGPVVGAPTEEWDRMISLNVQGLLSVTHAALPHLLHYAEQEPRRVTDIVNVSSAAGRMVRNGSAVYALPRSRRPRDHEPRGSSSWRPRTSPRRSRTSSPGTAGSRSTRSWCDRPNRRAEPIRRPGIHRR